MSIRAARAALRESRREGTNWRQVYQQALLDAEATTEPDLLPELTALAAAKYLTEGDHDAAVEQLRFGLAAAELSTTRAHLLAVESSVHMYAGDHETASAVIKEAWVEGRPEIATKAWYELSVYETMLRLVTLQHVDPSVTLRLALDARDAGFEWLHSGLIRWVVPWLFAVGSFRESQPWIDLLRANAVHFDHAWRKADADLFQAALDVAHDPTGPRAADNLISNEHRARWTLLELWRAGRRDDARTLANLRDQPDVPRDMRSTLRFADYDSTEADPPQTKPSLLNLPGALASAEIIARRGSSREARIWFGWLTQIPAHVQMSMEWPTPVEWLRGQLLLRRGRTVEARKYLEAAARWAATRRFGRRMGFSPFANIGLPLDSTGRAANRSAPPLTPRELDVLRALADGLRYREIASRLGISVNTVQSHARHLYAKLGTSSRTMALIAAGAEGLLGSS